MVFSCRGFEPVDFDPKDGWQAHGYTENVDSDDSEGKEQSVIRLQILKSSKSSSLVELTLFSSNQKEFTAVIISPRSSQNLKSSIWHIFFKLKS